MKIVAITVTYNSSISLENTIKYLLKQTIELDAIVIVDNCSDEENRSRVKAFGMQSSKIDIKWLPQNTGGAGGFCEGMKYVAEKYDPDWYWLMDDDAYPDADCLEQLIGEALKLPNVGFVAPLIWGIDNGKYQLYHARNRKGIIYKFTPVEEDSKKLQEVTLIDVDAFVGPLISSRAVKKCGFPRAEYFIEGDDTDYTFRVSREFNGYLIKNAKMNHRDIVFTEDINPKGWWKDYYWYRNTILFQLYNVKGVYKILGVLYVVAWSIKSKYLMYKNPKYCDYKTFRWKVMKRGVVDGLRRRGGARLLPADYKRELEMYEKTSLFKKKRGKGVENNYKENTTKR